MFHSLAWQGDVLRVVGLNADGTKVGREIDEMPDSVVAQLAVVALDALNGETDDASWISFAAAFGAANRFVADAAFIAVNSRQLRCDWRCALCLHVQRGL